MKRTQQALLAFEFLTFLAIAYLMYRFGWDVNDFFVLFLIIVYIKVSFEREQKYKCYSICCIVKWLGAISYWMFLLHMILIRLFVTVIPNQTYWKVLVLYIVSVVVGSSVMICIEQHIVKIKAKCK